MSQRDKPFGRRGALIALAAAALALGGCGRRSTPKPPEGSTYGAEYPTRRSMGLPPEEPSPAAPKDDEDEKPPAPGWPGPPTFRY